MSCISRKTGFGRTGRMFACEHEGVVPDFIALAKGLTGGTMPLAATLTTEKVFEAFLGDYAEMKTLFYGHSYCGNPLGCASALASLEVFEEEKTLDRLQPKIAFLRELLAEFEKLSSQDTQPESAGFFAKVKDFWNDLTEDR